ncbi:hypothetical protein Tco_0744577 [Tanacetum coccineum]
MILPADHVPLAVISARLQCARGPILSFLISYTVTYLRYRLINYNRRGESPNIDHGELRATRVIVLACGFAFYLIQSSQMANFAAKCSIMTQEMVDSFCDSFNIPANAPGRDKTITQFPAGKVVCAFYTRSYSDGLFSFVKRSTSAPSCFPKPPDSIKNWVDHFFWVDSCVFPIFVPLYTGGVLGKDPAPHLTARQEQTVKLLESHKAPFHRYPECFLCLVGLSPYYPFDKNYYPVFEHPDGSEMGLFDFIKTDDPRKVQAVEVQKGDNQVKLLESTQHCFMPLVVPATRGSSSAAVAMKDTNLELADLDEGTTTLRADHFTLVFGTGGKTLAGLEQIMPVSSHLLDREQLVFPFVAPSSQEKEGFLDSSAQASLRICATVESFSTLGILVDTIVAATDVNLDLVGPSHLEESEGSDDSFYAPPTLNPSEVKRWYVPRWNITNDSLLDDGFSCLTLVDRVAPPAFFSALRTMDYDQLYMKFNVGAAWQVCLGAEVRSRVEHELELKEKLKAKYVSCEKEVEAAEVIRLCDQVSSLFGEKSALTAEASSLRAGFQNFNKRMEIQQEQQAQELYNRVAELKAHVMDVSGHLEGEFYPTYLTTLARRRWFLTHGIQLALLKCLKSPKYQATLGHALGRAVDFGMQEGLKAGYEHGTAGRSLSVVDAYNRRAAIMLHQRVSRPRRYFPVPIHHAGEVIKHCRGRLPVILPKMSMPMLRGERKHAAGERLCGWDFLVALCKLMMEIVSAPFVSNWVVSLYFPGLLHSVEIMIEEATMRPWEASLPPEA